MTSLPISFVVAFLLVLLTASNYGQMKETATGMVFALVLYLYAISMVLIGIRWTWDVVAVLPLVATLSVVTSALWYLAFCSLGRHGPVVSPARDWVHLIPITLVALNVVLLPRWVDFSLIACKLLYMMLLVKLAREAPDSLQLVRLSWLKNTQHALWGAVLFLLISIAIDIAIAIDFARFDGRHAARLVGFVNLMILLLLGWVSVSAGRVRVSDIAADLNRDPDIDANADAQRVTGITEFSSFSPAGKSEQAEKIRHPGTGTDTDPAPDPDTDTDTDTDTGTGTGTDPDELSLINTLNKLLLDDRLYADTNLNLQRLARKAGVPARTVSRVINSSTGLNMSQWVNQARIDAVCTLLASSDITVSDAMFESGFLTKSNFNREFRRVKGCSPSEWRATQS